MLKLYVRWIHKKLEGEAYYCILIHTITSNLTLNRLQNMMVGLKINIQTKKVIDVLQHHKIRAYFCVNLKQDFQNRFIIIFPHFLSSFSLSHPRLNKSGDFSHSFFFQYSKNPYIALCVPFTIASHWD